MIKGQMKKLMIIIAICLLAGCGGGVKNENSEHKCKCPEKKLGEYNVDDRDLKGWLALLRDKDEHFVDRYNAVYAILELGNKTIIPELIEIYYNEDHKNVSCNIIKAIGEFGGESVIPFITEVLFDKNKDSIIRIEAAEVLGKISGKKAIPKLKKIVEEGSFILAGVAISVLGKIGDKSLAPYFITMLSDKEKRKNIRDPLCEALGNLGNRIAIPILIVALSEEIEWVSEKEAETALKKLTNKDFGKSPAKWRAWWEKNKDRILKADADVVNVKLLMVCDEFSKCFYFSVPKKILNNFVLTPKTDQRIGSPIMRFPVAKFVTLHVQNNKDDEQPEYVGSGAFVLKRKGEVFWARNYDLYAHYMSGPLNILKAEFLCYLIRRKDREKIQIYKTMFFQIFEAISYPYYDKHGNPITTLKFVRWWDKNKDRILKEEAEKEHLKKEGTEKTKKLSWYS